jgi:hypothetical protein
MKTQTTTKRKDFNEVGVWTDRNGRNLAACDLSRLTHALPLQVTANNR